MDDNNQVGDDPTQNNFGFLGDLVRAFSLPLIKILELAIGEGKIQDEDRPEMFLATLIAIFAPLAFFASKENPNVRWFLYLIFGFFTLIIVSRFVLKLRKRTETQKGELELVIFVWEENRAMGVPGADVFITGTKDFSGKTKKNGKVTYKYPSEFTRQNQNIFIFARKTENSIEKRSQEYEFSLVDRTEPFYVQIIPKPIEPTSPEKTVESISLKSQTIALKSEAKPEQIKVFISYSTVDKKPVAALKKRLSDDGYDVWIDNDRLQGGARFTIELENAIRTCDIVVAVMSSTARNSRWVRNEILFAVESDKVVVPAVIEKDLKLPIEIYSNHYIDFFSNFDAGYVNLVSQLIAMDIRSDITKPTTFNPTQNLVSDELLATSANPFLYGSAIPEYLFWGRRTVLQEIVERLGAESAQSLSVVGNRRIGKTSLLNYFTKNHQSLLREDLKSVVVYMDMMDAGVHTVHDVMRTIRIGLSGQLDNELLWAEVDDGNIRALSETFQSLAEEHHHRIILCFDEFENVMAHPELDDLVYTLRSIGSLGYVSMLVATRHKLRYLNDSLGLISEFYSIFDTHILGLFSEQEWKSLVTSAFERTNRTITETQLELIGELSGGHPHLTQLAGSLVWKSQDNSWSEDDIRQLYDEKAEDIFTIFWQGLNSVEIEVVKSVLGLTQTPDNTSAVSTELINRGILNASGDNVFCKLFGDFIKQVISN